VNEAKVIRLALRRTRRAERLVRRLESLEADVAVLTGGTRVISVPLVDGAQAYAVVSNGAPLRADPLLSDVWFDGLVKAARS